MDKDEIILMVKKAIANNSIPFNDSDEFVELDCFDVDNIADEVYEALYNAGYRKVGGEVVGPLQIEIAKLKLKCAALQMRNEVGQGISEVANNLIENTIKAEKKQAVREFAEKLKRDSICTAQYEDGTKILTTSNKLIDQAVNIYMQTEGLI